MYNIEKYNCTQLITYDGGKTWIDISPSIILKKLNTKTKN